MKAAWFSCALRQATSVGLYRVIDERPQLIISQGDTPYLSDFVANFRGYTSVAATTSLTVEQALAHHHQQMADPAFVALQDWRGGNQLYWYSPDDHDFGGGDNWDHTVTQANASPSIGAASQADVDAHWHVCSQALTTAIATYSDNPANVDAPSVDKPSSADAGTPASQYPVRYWRQGFDFDGVAQAPGESGDIEYFMLDCISGRSPLTATDNASKLMLGANQLAWLKARLSASTATWKIISGKKTRRAQTGDNGDVWSFYGTQLAEILDYIASEEIKGVIWIAGDKHTPHVISQSVAAGDTYDHVCVVACPISVPMNGALTGTLNGIVWQGPQHPTSRCYGVLELGATEALLYIKAAHTGNVLWRGRMVPTSNAMAYAAQRFAL